jgi:hypothetical protein
VNKKVSVLLGLTTASVTIPSADFPHKPRRAGKAHDTSLGNLDTRSGEIPE